MIWYSDVIFSYIPPCGVVVLHLDVGLPDTNVQEGRDIIITCYLGNITVQERYGQNS